MDINQLKKNLAYQARFKGICEEWYNRILSVSTKRELLEMYIDGIDFCISSEFPSSKIFKEFPKKLVHEFGVFHNAKLNLKNNKMVVCLGESILTYSADNYAVCQLFLKHSTQAEVVAKDSSFVMIDIFDSAVLNLETRNESKVCVNIYKGAKVEFNKKDNSHVRIIYKKARTYE